MPTNYCDAARRHWDDALYLHDDRRLPNADQLYALAAECALKAVVVGLGGKTKASGDLDEEFGGKHADRLWDEYRGFANARTASRYLAPLGAFPDNPFADWNVNQRYAGRAAPPTGEAFERHASAARACQLVLQRAMYDGIVTWTT